MSIDKEVWNLAPRIGRYKAVPANAEEAELLLTIHGTLEFEALSVGGPRGQVAIVPLDEASRDVAKLIAALPALLKVVRKVNGEAGGSALWHEAREALRKASD